MIGDRHDTQVAPRAGRERETRSVTSEGPAPLLLLLGLTAVAVLLRTWRLGRWGLEGDEIFTAVDSLRPSLSNPRPLLYFLNYYLIGAVAPLDELGLRLLPAVFGVLAIPALYFVGRRLIGSRAALFGALLLTLNPVHVYQSQYARYWSLVFLLSAVYPYALYWGVRERARNWLLLGAVAGVLAVLAHPVGVLPAGGLGLMLLLHVRRENLARLWSHRAVRWLVLLGLLVAVVAILRSVSLLQDWIQAHDLKVRVPDRLFRPKGGVLKQIGLLLAYVDDLTIPVAVTGALGITLLWQGRQRPVAILLSCLFVVPVASILLISLRTPVGTSYILPASPVVFFGAGALLGRLADVDLGLRPRWLLPATMTVVVVATGLPSLISQYRDGSRNDFRGAARWLEARRAPGDIVFSDEFRVMQHYLPGARVEHLVADTAAIAGLLQGLPNSSRGGAVWIVAPAPSHPFRANLGQGGLIRWVYDHCQLRTTLGVGRLDLRQNYLQIYRCPPPRP